MNLVCRNRLLISFFRRSEFGDAVKKSLPKAIPSPATAHSNITQASRWPFRNNASVSIKLTSDPGPDPIIAGRIGGRLSADTFATAQLAIAATMKQDSLVVELMRNNSNTAALSLHLEIESAEILRLTLFCPPSTLTVIITLAEGTRIIETQNRLARITKKLTCRDAQTDGLLSTFFRWLAIHRTGPMLPTM
jgi:hypothetical protein